VSEWQASDSDILFVDGSVTGPVTLREQIKWIG